MKFRFFLVVLFLILFCSCKADGNVPNLDDALNLSVSIFSQAISRGDVESFKEVASPEGLSVVRKFTSGNLGGRGEELSDNFSASSITGDMEFIVKNQTPVSLKVIFPGLPIKDYKKIPQHILPAEICSLAFDQWGASLKKTVSLLPESSSGEPVILKAPSNCWVYAEAQVIDEILVGGFAVFKKNGVAVQLVSIIELL